MVLFPRNNSIQYSRNPDIDKDRLQGSGNGKHQELLNHFLCIQIQKLENGHGLSEDRNKDLLPVFFNDPDILIFDESTNSDTIMKSHC